MSDDTDARAREIAEDIEIAIRERLGSSPDTETLRGIIAEHIVHLLAARAQAERERDEWKDRFHEIEGTAHHADAFRAHVDRAEARAAGLRKALEEEAARYRSAIADMKAAAITRASPASRRECEVQTALAQSRLAEIERALAADQAGGEDVHDSSGCVFCDLEVVHPEGVECPIAPPQPATAGGAPEGWAEGLYRFLLREFAADPDSGQAVTADVRPHFDALCQFTAAAPQSAPDGRVRELRDTLATAVTWLTALRNGSYVDDADEPPIEEFIRRAAALLAEPSHGR